MHAYTPLCKHGEHRPWLAATAAFITWSTQYLPTIRTFTSITSNVSTHYRHNCSIIRIAQQQASGNIEHKFDDASIRQRLRVSSNWTSWNWGHAEVITQFCDLGWNTTKALTDQIVCVFHLFCRILDDFFPDGLGLPNKRYLIFRRRQRSLQSSISSRRRPIFPWR